MKRKNIIKHWQPISEDTASIALNVNPQCLENCRNFEMRDDGAIRFMGLRQVPLYVSPNAAKATPTR